MDPKPASSSGYVPPPGMIARIDLSMTDDPPLAQAIVIISVRPAT